ncbi:ATP-binding protein [Streptomyces sp. HP-A2021]|uniref:ATP-binding protein n=1 Tax=Streptomyces sp. HP-A2021 TaxID=2927875 RepID=UPI001FAE7D2D|nr:ATP-binding protein [Streptomyces sp. HP-A2021]UOB08809.1 ATP-binding protein [Streptomyces sp. HP-A2021]
MSLTIPASGAATVRARQLTSYALTCWGLGQLLDDAKLVVTELVDNAVKAVVRREPASTEIGLRLQATSQTLMIEVEDPLTEWLPPRIHEARGLRLISAMTDDWGVRQSTTGKIVWATLSDEPPDYLCGPAWPASGEPWGKHRSGAG